MSENQKWIPVTERMPEHKGDYLVTFKLLFTYPVEVCYFDGQVWDKGQYDAVLAWMHLPEPYQAPIKDKVNAMQLSPSRPKGHWIINANGYYPYCSECKTEPKSGDMTDFCPSCGADMRP